MRLFSPKPNISILKEQLLEVVKTLDAAKIQYHLEGGTLLGCLRDGDLIPWDHDADISIMSDDLDRVETVIKNFPKRWKVSLRFFDKDYEFAKKGDLRLIKIKDRHAYFISGANTTDIFLKFRHEGKVYWEAAGNIMAVDKRYYDGTEQLSCLGRQLSTPVDSESYLTDKYGDWQSPVKEWHCSQEKTIVYPKVD